MTERGPTTVSSHEDFAADACRKVCLEKCMLGECADREDRHRIFSTFSEKTISETLPIWGKGT